VKEIDLLHAPPYSLLLSQIGNGACQLEDAVIGAGAQIHLLHGGAHEISAGFIQLAKYLHFRRAQVHFNISQQRFLLLHLTPRLLRPFQPNSDRRAMTVTDQKQLHKPEVRWPVTVTLDPYFLAMA
jgi:hypothetical protein